MKKTIQTLFIIGAISASLFTSCKPEPAKPEPKPTEVIVNDGAIATNLRADVDTITIKIEATADLDVKISNITISRSLNNGNATIISNKQYTEGVVKYTHKDIIKGNVVIDDQDIITYVITVTDSKGTIIVKTFVVNIRSWATSGQILLGASKNVNNDYKFFGVADNYRRYRVGTSGIDLASQNSNKIDFALYTDVGNGGIGNAIYSPSYFTKPSTSGGWKTEISSWPVVRNTVFVQFPMTRTQYDQMSYADFTGHLSGVDFDNGAFEKIANVQLDDVYAFRNQDGLRGLLLVGQLSSSDALGVTVFIVKSEL